MSIRYVTTIRYYPFAVNLDRCVGRCNTLNDLFNRVCIPNKAEDLNLNIFNIITGMNESKTLTKHISCECKFIFDGRKYNSKQKWNNDKCRCECKNPKKHHVFKKDYIWNSAICSCKSSEY